MVADLHLSPVICSGKCCAEPLTSLCGIRALKKWLCGLLITFLSLSDFIVIKHLLVFSLWGLG